jgi:Flp pilus assembly protein CpaB
MTYSVRNIVIALALAAVAGLLVIMYTSSVKKQATQNQQTIAVLVAKADIDAGTSVKEAIAAGDFQVRQVVQRDVVPGAFDSVARLDRGQATNAPIAAGSQITSGMFGESNSNPIQTQLKGLDRGVQLALNPNAVLGGTLHAGDSVDVVSFCTIKPTNTDSKFSEEDIGRVIMSDVPVLSTTGTGAASTALTADSQAANGSGSLDGQSGLGVILKLPQTQAATLVYTMHYCGIWLVVRPTTGAQDSPTVVANACTVFGSGLTDAQLSEFLPLCARKH